MAKSDARGRNFATIVYPESAPEDWVTRLCSYHVECIISPLHDRDVKDDGSGEIKKEHYHVMLMFPGNKSHDQLQTIFADIGGVGCERVESVRSMARYFCHLDEKDHCKPVYATEYAQSYCGADYDALINLPKDRYIAVREMIQYCVDNDVVSYGALLTYAMWHRDDWFRALCDNSSFVMDKFLADRRKQLSGEYE